MSRPSLLKSRIAPTPSGFLHLGNACNFLLTEALVRRRGGSLRLRIDDLDAARVRQEYLEDIFESLYWLGIAPDEGPKDLSAVESYSQQNRLRRYEEVLEELVRSGRVFACDCSRSVIQHLSKDGQYPGTCRDKGLPLDAPHMSWRFRTEPDELVSWVDGITGEVQLNLFQESRDFVVRRRDGIPAYHVASISDDRDFGTNLIVRGVDLVSSTAAQRWLAVALGWDEFNKAQFYHHPLLLDKHGGKLSKSAGSRSLRALRAAGTEAAEIREIARNWYTSFFPELRNFAT